MDPDVRKASRRRILEPGARPRMLECARAPRKRPAAACPARCVVSHREFSKTNRRIQEPARSAGPGAMSGSSGALLQVPWPHRPMTRAIRRSRPPARLALRIMLPLVLERACARARPVPAPAPPSPSRERGNVEMGSFRPRAARRSSASIAVRHADPPEGRDGPSRLSRRGARGSPRPRTLSFA